MDSLKNKVQKIIDDKSFNDLPIEQRQFIYKFLLQQQILTIYNCITSNDDLMCKRLKYKLSEWLKNCINEYEKNFQQINEKGLTNGFCCGKIKTQQSHTANTEELKNENLGSNF